MYGIEPHVRKKTRSRHFTGCHTLGRLMPRTSLIHGDEGSHNSSRTTRVHKQSAPRHVVGERDREPPRRPYSRTFGGTTKTARDQRSSPRMTHHFTRRTVCRESSVRRPLYLHRPRYRRDHDRAAGKATMLSTERSDTRQQHEGGGNPRHTRFPLTTASAPILVAPNVVVPSSQEQR